MKRGRGKLRLIVIVMIVALAGLVVVQASLLKNAIELKERAFSGNVMAALERASQELAAGEAATLVVSALAPESAFVETHVMAFLRDDPRIVIPRTALTFDSSVNIEVSDASSLEHRHAPVSIHGDTLSYSVKRPQHIHISAKTPGYEIDTVLVNSFHSPGDYDIIIDTVDLCDPLISWNYFARDDTGSHPIGFWDQSFSPLHMADSSKRRLVAQVFEGMLSAEHKPIESRLDSASIDSALFTAFADAGIELDYQFGVFSNPSDSLRISNGVVDSDSLHSSEFRVRLFPQDVFAESATLSVFFPDRQTYLWKSMTPMLGASVLFMLIIVSSFGITVRSFARQRRLSNHMVEFVNNMTHEFKTPISTVSLAAQALDRSEVQNDPQQISKFNSLIKQEATRMRSQAETILQMAALESSEISLSHSTLNLHDLLNRIVESFALNVKERGGTIIRDFAAKDSHFMADRVHISNVLHNLLDNALKYSPDNPHIVIKTFDSDRGIGVRVVDNGIGMSAEDRKQAFDKYFRASTGNLHNVKGFGLGLSYVKLIVEAHNGSISMHSAPQEGTEVELILPRNVE